MGAFSQKHTRTYRVGGLVGQNVMIFERTYFMDDPSPFVSIPIWSYFNCFVSSTTWGIWDVKR